MRTTFYLAFAFAVLASSSVVTAFPDADESQLLSKTSPGSAKRLLRVAGQEVVQSAPFNGYGGISKFGGQSINKASQQLDDNLKPALQKARGVMDAREAKKALKAKEAKKAKKAKHGGR